MTREEIAIILKNLRVASGLTQKEAAEALGKKQQTLASWETGQSQPDANTLFVLCAMYGVSVDEAFGFKKNNRADIQNYNKAFDLFNSLDSNFQEFVINQLGQLLKLQQQKGSE